MAALGTTTSIRLPANLRSELENASVKLHRGKNWLIIRALENYLNSLKKSSLKAEARRQSLLVSEASDDSEIWSQNTDTSDWQ